MSRNRIEEVNQIVFTEWFRIQYPKYEKLLNLGSFGENVGARRMKRLKAMGLTPGHPDLMLYVPRGMFHGLLIEMKTKTGRVSLIQKQIHDLLREQNYKVEVARSYEEAAEILKCYLKG